MKTRTMIGLVAVVGLLLAGASRASVIIYEDLFNGTPSSVVNGTTPDTTLGLHGGTAGATWTANAAIVLNGAGTESLGWGNNMGYLPFSPEANQVYTLTMYADFLGDWGAIGFTTSATPNINQNMHAAGQNTARIEYKASVVTLWANGGGTANTAVPGSAYNTVGLVLDTQTSGNWTVQGTLNGSLYGSAVNIGSPTIYGVAMSGGYSSNNMAVDSVTLTTSIPEPGSGLLLVAAASGLGLLRRKLRG